MIDRDRTIKKFGYDPDELKPKSNKRVCAICNNCGFERIIIKKQYRDLCYHCSHKGTFIKERNQNINEEKTKEDFGYTSDKLSDNSSKKVWAVCKNCGKERLLCFNAYGKFCRNCAQSGERSSSFGKKHTLETRKKMSENNKTLTGSKHSNWKGGRRASSRRYISKRRKLLDPNPIELNNGFINSEGHHINKKFIINIPSEIHKSISHRQTNGNGMHKINKLAFKYLLDNQENMLVSIESAYYINLMCL